MSTIDFMRFGTGSDRLCDPVRRANRPDGTSMRLVLLLRARRSRSRRRELCSFKQRASFNTVASYRGRERAGIIDPVPGDVNRTRWRHGSVPFQASEWAASVRGVRAKTRATVIDTCSAEQLKDPRTVLISFWQTYLGKRCYEHGSCILQWWLKEAL